MPINREKIPGIARPLLPAPQAISDLDRLWWNALGQKDAAIDAAAAGARDAFAAFHRRLRGECSLGPVQAAGPTRILTPPDGCHGAMNMDSCNFSQRCRVVHSNDEPPVQAPSPGLISPPDFTTFMRDYQDMVFSTAARITGNDAQAEDISQEVFLKAYDNFHHLRTSPAAGGWLKTVARNLSLNHLSRYRNRWRFFSEFRRPSDLDDRDAPEVEFAAPETFFAGIDAEERRAIVDEALAQLPNHQRVPLVLYHFEDMPYDEIAKKLRISLAKVKVDILRARAALAKIFSRSGTPHEKIGM